MSKNYIYQFTVDERGFTEVPFSHYTETEKNKENFVFKHLAPTLKAANAGWSWAHYKVMQNPEGHKAEFLVLWVGEVGNSGCRWINVSGNSLGAIMSAMTENMW